MTGASVNKGSVKLSSTAVGGDSYSYYDADYNTLVDTEVEFITGKTDIKDALPWFWEQGVKLVLYTCGKDGMYAYTKQNHAYAKAPAVEAVDTTGAGDASIGSFLWFLNRKSAGCDSLDKLSEKDINEVLKFAALYCSLSVQKKGAITSYSSIDELGLSI